MENNVILKLENISKDFFGNTVLTDINLEIKKGEILGLVGENGAGKSTLMKILFGLPEITETGGYGGKIIFDGKEVNFSSPFEALESGIGMVHQEFSLIPGFTTTENIVLNRESLNKNFLVDIFSERMSTLDREKMKERSEKSIKRLGVELDENMIISEMPVGHKQFTEIAREIERSNTKLLVLDEPTAVLTESEAEILLKTIKKLSTEGISIIFITHRLSEIISVCDTVSVLRDGILVNTVKTEETSKKQITEWMIGRKIDSKSESTDKKEENNQEIIMKIENLWVDMPGEIVHNFSVDVYKGEILGIGGLAGQGKLGIPNGIMGLYKAGGNVTFKNINLDLNNPVASLKKGIAFVSEDRRGIGLLLDEPIDLNIAFTAMQINNDFIVKKFGINWADSKKIKKTAKDYIEKLEIKCISEKQTTRQLSGGNQQKVCLARAFAMKPEMLFVSEPTRGIDVGAKKLVLDTLRKYNREFGTTIVMISSEIEELRTISDRIAIVSEGKISGILPPESDPVEFGELMVGIKDEVKQ
ncbi:MAG: sugar ABC transporter ATP-binding protein [Thermotogae bacterium]|nr:sugar ABC transporter ATP-binding protein [Thermotogota bacterium]MCP5465653.1 sugar ABC transporter ATP-binding protein [Thermotogota bacterium]